MPKSLSIAANHFPQIVWREGNRHLWNPIHRKALKSLPEERVRLRVVDYLLHGGWSKHRISTEEAIDLPQKETALRTDLICYTKDITPFLLVECKAENVTLSEKTAEQIARYNQGVQAPYLLLTNGRNDHWYALNEQSVQRMEGPPAQLPAPNRPETDFSYWQSRGFIGKNAAHALRQWMLDICQKLWFPDDAVSIRYLPFKSSSGDLNLSAYYRIFSMEEDRLALGFIATEFGSSRMVGILNRDGQNKAVLEVNLDFLFDERTPNASLYWAQGPKTLDVKPVIFEDKKPRTNLSQIVQGVNNLILKTI